MYDTVKRSSANLVKKQIFVNNALTMDRHSAFKTFEIESDSHTVVALEMNIKIEESENLLQKLLLSRNAWKDSKACTCLSMPSS